MPSRVIRGEINASRSLERVSMLADLTFRALLVAVDDYGRTDGRLHVLRALLFPTRKEVTEAKLDGWLSELAQEGCITRYEVDGAPYIELSSWEKHRGKGRRAHTSRFPQRSADCAGNPRISENPPENPGRVEGRGTRDEKRGTYADQPARSARGRVKTDAPEALEPEEQRALEGWCRERWPSLVPRCRDLVAACFTHHRAKGNRHADWYATAQTWIRNEAEGRFGKPAAPATPVVRPKGPDYGAAERARREAEADATLRDWYARGVIAEPTREAYEAARESGALLRAMKGSE